MTMLPPPNNTVSPIRETIGELFILTTRRSLTRDQRDDILTKWSTAVAAARTEPTLFILDKDDWIKRLY